MYIKPIQKSISIFESFTQKINEFNSKYDQDIKDLEAELKSGDLSDSEAKDIRNKLNMLKARSKMSNRPGGKEMAEDYDVKPELDVTGPVVAAAGGRTPPGAGNTNAVAIAGEEPVEEDSKDYDFRRSEPDANDQWEAIMDKLNQGIHLIEVGSFLHDASPQFKDKIKDDLKDVIRTLTEIESTFKE